MSMVIKVKHFQVDRTDKPPDWTAAEEFMNSILDTRKFPDNIPGISTLAHKGGRIINVSAYPTGNHHNMVVVYEEPKAEESGTRIAEGP